MSGVEKQAKILRRNAKVKKAMLASIAIPGTLAVAAVAPNALKLLQNFGYIKKKDPAYYMRTLMGRLKSDNLIEFHLENGVQCVRLTAKGRIKLLELGNALQRPKRWDKRWRLISFDIIESRKFIRDKTRRLLSAAGFYRLQDSLWVYPFDCEEVIGLLKFELGLRKDLLYMVVESIENDKHLRAHFDLS
jgi:DNA-binding transcriptional regulator PaaX